MTACLGQRSGSRLALPLVVGGLCLTGMAGGATAAHLTSSSTVETSASSVSDLELLQGGLEPPQPGAQAKTPAGPLPVTTSVAKAPSLKVADEETGSDGESRAAAVQTAPGPAVRPQPAAPPAQVSPPSRRLTPPAPARTPAPVPAPAPAPAPNAPPPMEFNLIPLKPQAPIQPKQLHIG